MSHFIRHFALVGSLSALALVTACASGHRHNEPIAAAPVVVGNASQYGNVSSIEVVPVASATTGGGAVLGAVIGAVIGNQIGHGGGRAAATGLGAVGGAVIGNSVEARNKSANDVYRVSVRYDNGAIGQFNYQRIDDLRVGDRVKVEGGQLYRV